MTNINITPEVAQALYTLRLHRENDVTLARAIETLDKAHIFRAIDEATGYDIDNPNPCTRGCVSLEAGVVVRHVADCAAAPDPTRDPAEYGDDTGYAHHPDRRAFSVSLDGITVSGRTKVAEE